MNTVVHNGQDYDVNEAMLWQGAPGTGINLQALLPSDLDVEDSEATSVDDNNDVFGYADDFEGDTYAVEWTVAVPEPAALGSLLICGMLTRRRRM